IKQAKNTCDCNLCLSKKFRFDLIQEGLDKFNLQSLDDLSDLNIALYYANEYFRMGQFIRAYRLLDKIRNLSLQRNEPILLFLASKNLLTLRNFIWKDYRNFKYENED